MTNRFKSLFKYTIAIVTALAATIALLEGTSNYTPAKTINTKAPVTTRRSIVIHAPSERVWGVFTNVNSWPSWQDELVSASLRGPFQPGSAIDWTTNGFAIHSVLQTVEAKKKIGWAGQAFGSFAIHVWSFEEHDGYTTVSVEESMEGWLVWLMQGYVQPNLHKATEHWLQALKTESEKLSLSTKPWSAGQGVY